MLQLMQVKGYQIHSTSGELGVVSDFLFDDREWVVRYVVVDTGGWLTTRQVLVTPQDIAQFNEARGELHLRLSKQQIEQSPPVGTDQPLTQERQSALAAYYGWPKYWTAVIKQTAAAASSNSPFYQPSDQMDEASSRSASSGLRSVKEVVGFALEATDSTIGTVEDLLAEKESWVIRYLLVDTGRWLPGRKVLISPSWMNSIDWSAGHVHLSLTKEGVQSSPVYDPAQLPDRDYETQLHQHYGKAKYWLAGKHDVPVRIG